MNLMQPPIRAFKKFRSYLRLKRIDQEHIPLGDQEVRLFVKVRNESLRIRYFLSYYFSIGVDRIFIVDNNSDDGTTDIALSFKKVHVFRTKETYRNHMYWIELLLRKYGLDRWCILADADEILRFPHSDLVSIKQLCDYLDRQKKDALQAFLLDMYSDKPIRLTSYSDGDDPLVVCPYFDANYSDYEVESVHPTMKKKYKWSYFHGGVQKNVFGIDSCLSKVPLFKYANEISISRGAHSIFGASLSSLRGVMLHFKYFSDFPAKVRDEVKRKVYYNGASEYQLFLDKLIREPDLNICNEKKSQPIKFQNNEQLINLQFMISDHEFDVHCNSEYLKTVAQS